MQDPQTAGFGAKCAVHPERIATRTCSRCGNFTCDECNRQNSEAMCPACRSLTGVDSFPFTRDNYSFETLWNFAFERWKKEWVMLSVCVLILMAVGMAVAVFNSVFQAIGRAVVGERGGMTGIIYITIISTVMSQVASAIAQGTFQMGLIRIFIDVLNGKKADIGRIMTQLPKLGRYIVQLILIQLMVVLPIALYAVGLVLVAGLVSGLAAFSDLEYLPRALGGAGIGVLIVGGLALIPVLVYVTLPLIFANMELVYGDSSPMESIRRAFVIAKGHRVSVLGFGVISFLIMLVGFIACCVGILPAVSLVYLLLVGLYLALRNGSGLPPPVET